MILVLGFQVQGLGVQGLGLRVWYHIEGFIIRVGGGSMTRGRG